LVVVDDRGLRVVPGAPRADLAAGAIGRRARALVDEAAAMAGRAMTTDLFGAVPDALHGMTRALS
ncbi:MAG: hypothetical protein ACPGRF_05655, partial [Miltoncostaeaceae bacterium]